MGVSMISPTGEAVDVPEADVGLFRRRGYSLESEGARQQRVTQKLEEEEYSGPAETAAALVSGGLSGLTLGLSDVGLRAAGADDLGKIRKYNPIASGVGEIAGAIAPALVSGGGSLGARGGGIVARESAEQAGRSLGAQILRHTPAGLATRAGEGIAARGVGKSTISEVLHSGVGFGVEGALFSSGQYLSDVALENKELSAEGFVGAMKQGALTGGAVGGTMAAASRAVGSFGRAAETVRKGEKLDTVPLARLLPKRSKRAKARLAKRRALEDEMARQVAQGESLVSMADELFKQEGAKQRALRTAQRKAAREDRRAQQLADELTSPIPTHERLRVSETGEEVVRLRGADMPERFTDPMTSKRVGDLDETRLEGIRDVFRKGQESVDDAWGATPPRVAVRRRANEDMLEVIDGRHRLSVAREFPDVKLPVKFVQGVPTPAGGRGAPRKVGVSALSRESRKKLTREERFRLAKEGLDADDAVQVGADQLGQQLTETAESMGLRQKVDEVMTSRERAMKWVQELKAKNPKMPEIGKRGAGGRPVGDAAGAREAFMDSVVGAKSMDEIMAGWSPPPAIGRTPDVPTYDPITGEIFEDIFDVAKYEKAQYELAQEMRPMFGADEWKRIDDGFKPYADAVAKDAGERATSQAGRGLLGTANTVGEWYEFAQMVGLPLPRIENLPVVGPLLGAYLKARLGLKMLGGTKVLRSPTAKVAEESSKVRDRISDALERLAKGTAKAAEKAKPVRPAVVPALSVLGYQLYSETDEPQGRRTKDEPKPRSTLSKATKDYESRLSELAKAATNPEATRRRILDQLHLGDDAMEKTIADAALRKLQFLYDKAPKDPREPNPLGIQARPWRPDRAELERFARYVRAAEDPAEVIEDLADGKISYEAAETLRKVYPETFRSVQEELADNLAEYRADLPYSRRVSLSILFDVPVEATMSPAFLAAMQEGFQRAPEPPQPQPPAPTVNPGVATNLGEMAESATLRRAAM